MLDTCLTLQSDAPVDADTLLVPTKVHALCCPQRLPILMTAFLESSPLRLKSSEVQDESSIEQVRPSVSNANQNVNGDNHAHECMVTPISDLEELSHEAVDSFFESLNDMMFSPEQK